MKDGLTIAFLIEVSVLLFWAIWMLVLLRRMKKRIDKLLKESEEHGEAITV